MLVPQPVPPPPRLPPTLIGWVDCSITNQHVDLWLGNDTQTSCACVDLCASVRSGKGVHVGVHVLTFAGRVWTLLLTLLVRTIVEQEAALLSIRLSTFQSFRLTVVYRLRVWRNPDETSLPHSLWLCSSSSLPYAPVPQYFKFNIQSFKLNHSSSGILQLFIMFLGSKILEKDHYIFVEDRNQQKHFNFSAAVDTNNLQSQDEDVQL